MFCIVIFKSIQNMDDILPLIFELKKIGVVSHTIFVANNMKTYGYIKENIVLYDGISSVGGSLTFFNRFNNRYLNLLFNIFILRKCLYQKNISIEMYRVDKWISILLACSRKVWKGKRIYSWIYNRPFRQARNIVKYYELIGRGKDYSNGEWLKRYDCALLSFSRDQHEVVYGRKLTTDCSLVEMGYTRALGEWKRYLATNAARYIPNEIKTPYIFFSIDSFGNWAPKSDHASYGEKFEECLNVLKDINDDIMTVFKPNPRTDVSKAYEILNLVGYKNYIISYAHPLILIDRAKFFFACHPTSLLIDAYFHGCHTVEYAHYDRRFYDYNKGQPMFLECVDSFIYRDVEKLKRVLNELVYNDIPVERDFNRLHESYPILTSQDIKEKFNWLM